MKEDRLGKSFHALKTTCTKRSYIHLFIPLDLSLFYKPNSHDLYEEQINV